MQQTKECNWLLERVQPDAPTRLYFWRGMKELINLLQPKSGLVSACNALSTCLSLHCFRQSNEMFLTVFQSFKFTPILVCSMGSQDHGYSIMLPLHEIACLNTLKTEKQWSCKNIVVKSMSSLLDSLK